MTILTINEAAEFLRVTKRTLYRHMEIPRIRIGHQLKFVREDLEAWIESRREGLDPSKARDIAVEQQRVDEARPASYHRNPVFRLTSSRSA
ncbi:MAG: helix-turn-helix domain-containing protein [Nitrospira sp.]|nr:helix-turn-helix domain-containing protein [Nitrospira sp.]